MCIRDRLPDKYMSDYNVSIENVKSRPGWQVISAVKNNRIYFINDDMIFRPGPRLVDALELLAKYIHPEALRAISVVGDDRAYSIGNVISKLVLTGYTSQVYNTHSCPEALFA